jgi:hypothetical protein
LKPEQVKLMRQTLESVKTQAKNDTVTGNISIPAKAMDLAGDLLLKAVMFGSAVAEPSTPVPALVPRKN